MKNSANIVSIFLILLLIGLGCEAPEETPTTNAEKEVKKPSSPPDTDIEFVLDLSEDEKNKNTKIIRSLPEYKTFEAFFSKLGFDLEEMKTAAEARKYPVKGELTGLIFSTKAEQSLDTLDYRILLMGPTDKRVEDVRIQSYGSYSRKAREKLLGWAGQLLKEINRGEIPDSFSKRMLKGESVSGDEHFSNGSCELSVLQKRSNSPDPRFRRISLDLTFRSLR